MQEKLNEFTDVAAGRVAVGRLLSNSGSIPWNWNFFERSKSEK